MSKKKQRAVAAAEASALLGRLQPRRGWNIFTGAMVVTLAWWLVICFGGWQRLQRTSNVSLRANPPGMAAGSREGRPPDILPYFAARSR